MVRRGLILITSSMVTRKLDLHGQGQNNEGEPKIYTPKADADKHCRSNRSTIGTRAPITIRPTKKLHGLTK